MIDVYAFATPNSLKVPIALEELGLDYVLHAVDIKRGEQRAPQFLALNPNGKVPVLVESGAEGRAVLTESAAILVHLAETHDALLPSTGMARARVFEQLFFHASAVSPAYGQAGFFKRLAAEPQPLALQRFEAEARRVTGLLDATLARHPFVAGDAYSIADIAHFGWIWRHQFPGLDLADTPHVAAWHARMLERPAVQRAIARVNALVPA
ncbi:glutathione S-transferase family protein [Roseateles cellulosilyticus]|uniref:Glutathione S-transferase family protein n=1 Tax=Pelomonas cellulosilytica TaxID=2906762 RepID=A0ABS8XSC4_9BURK|nr:glutathione S-transferase family protein [Pelomonas sp. P8]MCE4555604.1 glutathione S-transferase family protein [Pelomonas sp. P8]